jgi:hypothetical protein
MSLEKMSVAFFMAVAASLGIGALVSLTNEVLQNPSNLDTSLSNDFLSQSSSSVQPESILSPAKLLKCQTEVATSLGFPFPNKIEAHSAYNSYGGGNLQTPQIDFYTRATAGSADPQTTIIYSGLDGVSSYKIEWGKATNPVFNEPSPVDQDLSEAEAKVEVIARDLNACMMAKPT